MPTFSSSVVREVCENGAECVGLGRVRIDCECLIQVHGGKIAAFGINEVFGQHKMRADVTRIYFQCPLGVSNELLAITISK